MCRCADNRGGKADGDVSKKPAKGFATVLTNATNTASSLEKQILEYRIWRTLNSIQDQITNEQHNEQRVRCDAVRTG